MQNVCESCQRKWTYRGVSVAGGRKSYPTGGVHAGALLARDDQNLLGVVGGVQVSGDVHELRKNVYRVFGVLREMENKAGVGCRIGETARGKERAREGEGYVMTRWYMPPPPPHNPKRAI